MFILSFNKINKTAKRNATNRDPKVFYTALLLASFSDCLLQCSVEVSYFSGVLSNPDAEQKAFEKAKNVLDLTQMRVNTL
jgi:hypothetical protein